MLKTLSKYDTKTSAGILARTAMILDDNYNPHFSKTISNEDSIRQSLLKEISDKMIQNVDSSKRNTLIVDYIDNQLYAMSNIQSEEAIDRLSETAYFPSDLFQIDVIKNIKDFYMESFNDEFKLISETVKNPESEFYFQNTKSSNEPLGISLFVRKFIGNFPYNNFNLLIVGQRKSKKFVVHQAWRLYDDIMDYQELNSLINLLEIFADRFGVEVEFRNKFSNFFLNEIAISEKEFKVNFKKTLLVRDKKGHTNFTVSHFTNVLEKKQKIISMLLAIDLVKYKKYLRRHNYKLD